jgi:Fe-S-cluster-containing dehydrogenase component
MQRRKFLALLSSAGLAATLPAKAGKAASVSGFSGHPDAVGVLHDSARCIGCRRCEAGCQKVNAEVLPQPDKRRKPAKPFDDLSVLDKKRRTDFQSYTVVNKYHVEGREAPVFRKFQCNHCQEPACASACFVKAFVKTPEGPVLYRPDLCVGCRYCMIACPYYVPAYDYHSVFNPLVYKCTMCAPRLAKGLLPGCVESCPKDALTFGKRSDLLVIARERIASNPGMYVDHIYGEHEMGGANWLYLSPVPHSRLDQPELGKTSAPELTSGALGSVAMVAGIWPVLLGGAYVISKRREKTAAEERQQAVAQAVERTKSEAGAALAAALAKAAKDKDATVAREVKKAREEAIKEMEAKTAAAGDPAKTADASGKGGTPE